MIPEIGLHNIKVAGLTAGVKAPVVEFRHHLSLGNIFIQAAVSLGAVVLGMLPGQGREAVLRHFAGFPHFQHILCPLLTGRPGFLREFLRADGVAGGALRHNEDMAHIHKNIVLVNPVFRVARRVLVKIGLNFRIRYGIALRNLGVVAQTLIVQVQETGIIVISGRSAQHSRHQIVNAVKPGAFRGLGQLIGQRIHFLPVFRRHLDAVLFRLCRHGLVALPAQQRLTQKILLPGLPLHSRTQLGIQPMGVVQAKVRKIGAVLGKKLPHLHPVINLKLTHCQFIFSGSRHHGIPGGDYIRVRGGVAALAGNIVRIAVGGDGIFHRFLRGLSLLGFRRKHRFGFFRRFGVFPAKAADHKRNESRHKHHHKRHRQGNFSRGCFHARLDFRPGIAGGLFLFFLRVRSGGFLLHAFPGRVAFFRGFLFRGNGLFLRLLRSPVRLRPGVLCLGHSLFHRNLRVHFTGILFLFVHKNLFLHKMESAFAFYCIRATPHQSARNLRKRFCAGSCVSKMREYCMYFPFLEL